MRIKWGVMPTRVVGHLTHGHSVHNALLRHLANQAAAAANHKNDKAPARGTMRVLSAVDELRLNRSDGFLVFFTGADADHPLHVKHKDFTVTNPTGLCGFHNGVDTAIYFTVRNHDIKFDLG